MATTPQSASAHERSLCFPALLSFHGAGGDPASVAAAGSLSTRPNSRFCSAGDYIRQVRGNIILGLTLLLGIAGLPAASAADEIEVNDLYRRGLAGDKAAVVECIDRLEAVLKSDGGNQLARVYLGSAYTLRSRDLGFGPKKLKALNHGIALMDEAVSAAPNDLKVRLARALTTQSLPFFSGRAASSRKDFQMLAAAAHRSPEKLNEGELQVIFYNAGLAAKVAGDHAGAAALFREGLKHGADTALSVMLHAELGGR